MRNCKYMIGDDSLRNICIKNNISYTSVASVARSKSNKIPLDELVRIFVIEKELKENGFIISRKTPKKG